MLRGFRVKEVPADNNCQFHALIDQFEQQGIGSGLTAHSLREKAVQWLSANGDMPMDDGTMGEHSLLKDSVGADNWSLYLEEMSKHDVTWGDEATLLAASVLFQVEICIISSLSAEYCHVVTPPEIWQITLHARVVLGHYAEYHYASTVPNVAECPCKPASAGSLELARSIIARLEHKDEECARYAYDACLNMEQHELLAHEQLLVQQLSHRSFFVRATSASLLSRTGSAKLLQAVLADDSDFWNADMAFFICDGVLDLPPSLDLRVLQGLFDRWSSDANPRVRQAAQKVVEILYAPGGAGFEAARTDFQTHAVSEAAGEEPPTEEHKPAPEHVRLKIVAEVLAESLLRWPTRAGRARQRRDEQVDNLCGEGMPSPTLISTLENTSNKAKVDELRAACDEARLIKSRVRASIAPSASRPELTAALDAHQRACDKANAIMHSIIDELAPSATVDDPTAMATASLGGAIVSELASDARTSSTATDHRLVSTRVGDREEELELFRALQASALPQ